MTETSNEYETERARIIARNRSKLEELGLSNRARQVVSGLQSQLQLPRQNPRPVKRQRASQEDNVPQASRKSRRVLKEEPPYIHDLQKELSDLEADQPKSRAAARGRLPLSLTQTPICGPFSLRSICTTVWEVGAIHRGPWKQRYWSSSGCLWHHAYPVGYRAEKLQFGRLFEMRILAGAQGPIFQVLDKTTGAVYSGTSPTKPWTSICIAHRTGQRISGPLYFGFSDVVTQRAIAALYTPEELQAAQQGRTVASADPTAEERAVAEFMTIPGVGEATAIALALNTSLLGGARFAGVGALRAWVAAAAERQQALVQLLLHSEEIPAATRRWPAWRHRMVPGIVLALAGSAGSASAAEGDVHLPASISNSMQDIEHKATAAAASACGKRAKHGCRAGRQAVFGVNGQELSATLTRKASMTTARTGSKENAIHIAAGSETGCRSTSGRCRKPNVLYADYV